MPQYTLKELFLATTLAALGLGMIVIAARSINAYSYDPANSSRMELSTYGAVLMGGGCTVAFGVFYPSTKSRLAAWAISTTVIFIVCFLAACLLNG